MKKGGDRWKENHSVAHVRIGRANRRHARPFRGSVMPLANHQTLQPFRVTANCETVLAHSVALRTASDEHAAATATLYPHDNLIK